PSWAKRARRSGCASTFTTSWCSLPTTAGGVPAGAKSPNQETASKPGKPDSATVGNSGMLGERCSDVRQPAQPARADGRQDGGRVLHGHRDASAHDVGKDRALVRDMGDVRAGEDLEQLEADVLRGAGAGAGVGELARVRL